ncbi:MAG: chemotaxis protein CheR [Spirochaetes bacterium RIFOXYC1_FULL_54_7]|nr:MAG: chemotaxis protein CheR [Spirochaetes bacterium RIFOXYC1_FULL_54_7]
MTSQESTGSVRSGISERGFRRLSAFIESELGIRMPDTKRIMLESRLQKRLRVLGLPDFETYIDRVFSGDDVEMIHMIDAVTTNKTDFFREPDHFDILSNRLLPAAMTRNPGRSLFSFWSAGCATGEEPYTLAMVLEEFRSTYPGFDYHILASDISSQALQKAFMAVYDAEKVIPVPPGFKRKYLLRSKDPSKVDVRIKKELRDKVEFIRLNFMDDHFPFDGKFDVIFCRNVIIYFDRPTQERLLGHMCGYLRPGGNLILGHSETLTGMSLPLRSLAPTVYERL